MIEKLKRKIDDLERRVRELEQRPVYIPYPYPFQPAVDNSLMPSYSPMIFGTGTLPTPEQ